MGNITNSNPVFVDTAAVIWSKKPTPVSLIQWVDDAGDIIHDSTLVLIINGVTLTVKIQPLVNALGFGAVAWQIGPFLPGIPIDSFEVSAMDTGNLLVWID